MTNKIVKYNKDKADIIISPQVEGIKLLNWKALDKALAAGEEAVRKSIPSIRHLLKSSIQRK